MSYKKLLLIDLDGVLNQYDGKYNPDLIPDIKIGAKEFLKNLSENYDIKIFTARNLLLTSKWLITNKLDKYVKDVTNIKEPAYLHIDDRCVCFTGNYKETLEDINNFVIHWK